MRPRRHCKLRSGTSWNALRALRHQSDRVVQMELFAHPLEDHDNGQSSMRQMSTLKRQRDAPGNCRALVPCLVSRLFSFADFE